MIDGLSEQRLQHWVVDIVSAAKIRHAIPDGCSGSDACKLLNLSLGREVIHTDGMYLEDQSLIIVNETITWQPRVEFTIFHEIMHHLIIDEGDLFSALWDASNQNDGTFTTMLERCCEMGAAEFLMPRATVRESIYVHGLSVDLIERVAREHSASLEAAAIQVAVCAPFACYVVLGAHGVPRKGWPAEPCLFVDRVFWPAQNRYPMARYIRIPTDHLFHQAWREGQPVKGQTYVLSRRGAKDWSCDGEAAVVGSRVVGILLLEKPIIRDTRQARLPI